MILKKIYLGLGSNIGDRDYYLDEAISFLMEYNINVVQESKRYTTQPMYYLNQEDFLNSVIEIETQETPFKLLEICKKIENKMGRKKEIEKGPRNIDIDILIYKNIKINTLSLSIPHKGILERDFVLKPLREITSNKDISLLRKFIKS